MWTDYQPVEPGRGQVKLSIGGQGVSALKKPLVPILDSHSTVAGSVPEEGDQVYLWSEGQADGVEAIPLVCRLFVECPARVVGKIQGVIGKLTQNPRLQHCLVFSLVNVNQGVGKIWQAAGMVKMQVGQEICQTSCGEQPIRDSWQTVVISELREMPKSRKNKRMRRDGRS